LRNPRLQRRLQPHRRHKDRFATMYGKIRLQLLILMCHHYHLAKVPSSRRTGNRLFGGPGLLLRRCNQEGYRWDDALDVWGEQGGRGGFGAILLGVFAARTWNLHGAAGLLSGALGFFLWQCIAVFASAASAFDYAALWLINYVTSISS